MRPVAVRHNSSVLPLITQADQAATRPPSMVGVAPWTHSAFVRGGARRMGGLGAGAEPLTVVAGRDARQQVDITCAADSSRSRALNLNLGRRITQGVPSGMALEGLTAADVAYQNST